MAFLTNLARQSNPASPRNFTPAASPLADPGNFDFGYGAMPQAATQQQGSTFGLRQASQGNQGTLGQSGPYGSLGNTSNMFGGRMGGTQRNPWEQNSRNQAFQNILGGGGGGGSGAGVGMGVPNNQNPFNFDNAFRATQDRQNAIMSLIAQNQGNLGAGMTQAQSAYQNPTGLDPALLASLRQESQAANAAAMQAMQKDARGQLASSGFSNSPAATWVDAQIRGQGTQADLQRRNEIAMQDATARLQNQQRAQDWISQLLGLQSQNALQGGNLIGQMQTPYLTPEAAGAMGYGGGGGGYGNANNPANIPSTNNGFISGTLFGNAGSNAQYNTALGNAEYRRRTGQDLPRTYGGQAFFGYR